MKVMKILTSALLIFVMTLAMPHLYAQQHVDEQLKVKQWMDEETLTIFGHPITRIFGETYNRNQPRNYHIPITNIGYKTLNQLIADARQKAADEGLSDQQLEQNIAGLQKEAPGGRLYVYIERRDNDRANGRYFFVILRDKNENEFYKKDFPNQPPVFGDFGFWGNLFTANLPEQPPYPFYVYVDDRESDHLSDFKFEVLK